VTKTSDSAKKDDAPDTQLDPQAVKAYLRAHPEVLLSDEALLAEITPAAYREDGTVRDLQRYLIERQRERLQVAEDAERALEGLVEVNTRTQAQVLEAVLLCLDARGFEDMIDTITKDVPTALGLEAVVLGIETRENGLPADPARLPGLRLLAPGSVDAVLGKDVTHILRGELGAHGLFSDTDAQVQSEALIRLHLSNVSPPGVLAFGAGDAEHFAPDQAVDLLTFLARAIERILRLWLDLPPPKA